jgi:hypothetical protein
MLNNRYTIIKVIQELTPILLWVVKSDGFGKLYSTRWPHCQIWKAGAAQESSDAINR